MRKSKLFLTIALVITVITGVAATKGMKTPRAVYYYQKGNACVLVSQVILCEIGNPVCKFVESGVPYQIFGFRISPNLCSQPLQPE